MRRAPEDRHGDHYHAAARGASHRPRLRGLRIGGPPQTGPDAPIGHFRFNLSGGKVGYLVNTRDLCGKRAVSIVEFSGQNGKVKREKVAMKAACGKAKKRGK